MHTGAHTEARAGAQIVYPLFHISGTRDGAGDKGLFSECMAAEDVACPEDAMRFCAGDDVLDRELAVLHEQLLGESGEDGVSCRLQAQLEIDRRLHACYAADTGWRVTLPLHWLFTPVEYTMQYKLLPDIIRFMTNCVTKPLSSFNLIESLVYNAMPCFRKCRFLQRSVDVQPVYELVVCINVLYGTLLGLFPSCSKKPVFHIRKYVTVYLRALTTSTLENMANFMKTHPCLVRLCFMEYVVNTKRDFCSVEKSDDVDVLHLYYSACTNICDNFRVEALQSCALDWELIESKAAILIDRFIRTCKLRNNRGEVQRPCATLRNMLQGRSGRTCEPLLREALTQHMSHLPNSSYMAHARRTKSDNAASRETASLIYALQHNVTCHTMPSNIVQQMYAQMKSKYGGDMQLIHGTTRAHLCMWCINKITGNPLQQKLRLDLETNQLMCVSCGDNLPVVSVNVVGRLLCVNHKYYYICPVCLTLQLWGATGTEFSSCVCNHHTRCRTRKLQAAQALTLHKHETPRLKSGEQDVLQVCNTTSSGCISASLPASLREHVKCHMCGRKTALNYICTPNVSLRRMCIFFFCNRHRVAPHLLPFVHDSVSLDKILLHRV